MNCKKRLKALIQEAERRDQVALRRTAKWMLSKNSVLKRHLHDQAEHAKHRAADGWRAVEDARNAGWPEPPFNPESTQEPVGSSMR